MGIHTGKRCLVWIFQLPWPTHTSWNGWPSFLPKYSSHVWFGVTSKQTMLYLIILFPPILIAVVLQCRQCSRMHHTHRVFVRVLRACLRTGALPRPNFEIWTWLVIFETHLMAEQFNYRRWWLGTEHAHIYMFLDSSSYHELLMSLGKE